MSKEFHIVTIIFTIIITMIKTEVLKYQGKCHLSNQMYQLRKVSSIPIRVETVPQAEEL